MAVLSARDKTCVNPDINSDANRKRHVDINELCVHATRKSECRYYDSDKKKSHLVLDGILDIEDMVALGKEHSQCPFYASRQKAATADIVFCPYK